MNIYYTAKDIEEMAAQGMRQIELGSGVTLTDFAKETALQLGITLVENRSQMVLSTQATPPGSAKTVNNKYNKPSGCLHSSNSNQTAPYQAAAPSGQSANGSASNTVNRLVDLFGKVVKRGG